MRLCEEISRRVRSELDKIPVYRLRQADGGSSARLAKEGATPAIPCGIIRRATRWSEHPPCAVSGRLRWFGGVVGGCRRTDLGALRSYRGRTRRNRLFLAARPGGSCWTALGNGGGFGGCHALSPCRWTRSIERPTHEKDFGSATARDLVLRCRGHL